MARKPFLYLVSFNVGIANRKPKIKNGIAINIELLGTNIAINKIMITSIMYNTVSKIEINSFI